MRVQRADPELDRRDQVPRATLQGRSGFEGTATPSQGAEVRVFNETDAEAYRALRLQALEQRAPRLRDVDRGVSLGAA